MKKVFKILAVFLITTCGLIQFVGCGQESNITNVDTSEIRSETNSTMDSLEIQKSRECLAKALSNALKNNLLRNEVIELHKTVPKGYDGFFLSEIKDQKIFMNNTMSIKEILTPELSCDSNIPDVIDHLCQKDPLLIIMVFNPLKNYQFNSTDIKVFLPQDNIEELPSSGFSMAYFLNGIKNTWNVKEEPGYNVFVLKKSERARIKSNPNNNSKILYSFSPCGNIIEVLYYAPPSLNPRTGPTDPEGGEECPRETIKKTEYFEEFYSEDDSEGCCFKGDADFRMHFIWGTVTASNEIVSLQTDDHAFGWDESCSKNNWVDIHAKIIDWNPTAPKKDSDRMKYYLVEEDSGGQVQIEVGFKYKGADAALKIDVSDNHDYIGSEIVEWCSPLLEENKVRQNWDCFFKSTMK